MRIGSKLGIAILGWGVLVAISTAGAQDEKAKEPKKGAEVARVQSIPLGGKLDGLSGDRQYGVYVPTKFGGELTLTTSSGEIEALTGPDGKARQNGKEVGNDAHGWYTFKVKGAKDKYEVETSFVQLGKSARKPWNFYYWPTKADSLHEPWAGGNGRVDTPAPVGDDVMLKGVGSYVAPGEDIILAGPNGLLETTPSAGDTSTWFPNLYDDLTWRGPDGTMFATPSPMLKYDQLFNLGARAYEANFTPNKDISRWPGHCLGGAVASILLNEPSPAPWSGMTKDELKGLWAELGENHYNHRIGDYANLIPPGPPRAGFDETDRFVARFHQVLESHIRGQKQALLGNLRAFPPRGTNNEVWNHGIGEYVATYHAVPGQGERAIKMDIELRANSGSCLNGQDDKPRIVNYQYKLVYGLDGGVDETNVAGNDWISVGGEAMFAPLNLLEVVETKWAGHNPSVTEQNIRSIDLANGGNTFARSGGAPQFRPVGTYEAGRPMLAGSNSSLNSPSTPSRGLFRGIFGRR